MIDVTHQSIAFFFLDFLQDMQENVLFNHVKVHADQVKHAADCLGRLNFFFASLRYIVSLPVFGWLCQPIFK